METPDLKLIQLLIIQCSILQAAKDMPFSRIGTAGCLGDHALLLVRICTYGPVLQAGYMFGHCCFCKHSAMTSVACIIGAAHVASSCDVAQKHKH